MDNDKSALKAAMLSAISEELDLWLVKESNIEDSYECDNEFLKPLAASIASYSPKV